MTLVTRSFYARDTVKVAQDLLGKTLVRDVNGIVVSGIIVETEAYRYKDDPASHSYGGMTERNKAMFGQVGRAYVYFTYGMHFCVNAVARSPDYSAGAVLIRSIIPQQGIDFMSKQRKTSDISNLANGPAKLTQALQITKNRGKLVKNNDQLYFVTVHPAAIIYNPGLRQVLKDDFILLAKTLDKLRKGLDVEISK